MIPAIVAVFIAVTQPCRSQEEENPYGCSGSHGDCAFWPQRNLINDSTMFICVPPPVRTRCESEDPRDTVTTAQMRTHLATRIAQSLYVLTGSFTRVEIGTGGNNTLILEIDSVIKGETPIRELPVYIADAYCLLISGLIDTTVSWRTPRPLLLFTSRLNGLTIEEIGLVPSCGIEGFYITGNIITGFGYFYNRYAGLSVSLTDVLDLTKVTHTVFRPVPTRMSQTASFDIHGRQFPALHGIGPQLTITPSSRPALHLPTTLYR